MEELLSDERVLKFLLFIAERDIRVIEPVITEKEERFPELEATLGLSGKEILSIIKRLVKEGLLERVVYDAYIVCPVCGSSNTKSRYVCIRCGSFNIKRARLIEHLICGYINTESKFEDNTCPQCNRTLTAEGIDYRIFGRLFECFNCGHRFNIPEIENLCLDCKHRFNYVTAEIVLLEKYEVNDKKFSEIKEAIIESEIARSLKDIKYNIKKDVSFNGDSGISHTFKKVYNFSSGDLYVYIIPNPRDKSIYETLSKILDVKNLKSIMVSFGNVPGDIKNILNGFGVKIIELNNIDEFKDKFLNFLKQEKLIGEKELEKRKGKEK